MTGSPVDQSIFKPSGEKLISHHQGPGAGPADAAGVKIPPDGIYTVAGKTPALMGRDHFGPAILAPER